MTGMYNYIYTNHSVIQCNMKGGGVIHAKLSIKIHLNGTT